MLGPGALEELPVGTGMAKSRGGLRGCKGLDDSLKLGPGFRTASETVCS